MTIYKFSSEDYASLGKLILGIQDINSRLYDMDYEKAIQERKNKHPNSFCKFGRKIFSQTDEDGLIFEIVKRIGLEKAKFGEIGVGNGLENNTLALIAAGWSGFWVGGEELAISTEASKKLFFKKDWVTAENVLDLYSQQLAKLDVTEIDLLSVDIDGNDFYIAKKLLEEGVKPKVFIIEYNAKFAPPIRFKIKYNPKYTWADDDYFGASLCELNDLFEAYGYTLICCNAATGANAFFVKNEFGSKFPEVPTHIEDIHVSPFYFLYRSFGHKSSPKTAQEIINS